MSKTEDLRAAATDALRIFDWLARRSIYTDADMATVHANLRAALAQQPAASGEPVAWRAQIDELWFHGRDRDGLRTALALSFAREIPADQVEPLYAAPQPAPARVPPEDWSVFNDSACVADGLTYAEALDYLTHERLQRGWSAVCVANRDNIVDAAPTAQQEPKP